MLRFPSVRCLSLAFLLPVLPALAQPAAGGAAAPSWRSAFEGYQPFADAPVAPWRESNDTVGRVGGWRAYAQEARQSAAAGTTAPAPASPPPAGPAPRAPAAGHSH